MDDDCNITSMSDNEENKTITTSKKCKPWFRHHSQSKCSLKCSQNSMKMSERSYLPPSVLSTVHHFGKDPSLDLLKQKEKYIFKLNCLQNSYNSACSNLDVKRQYNCYFELDEHMELDPDPNFHSNYNWYYTGGCLEKRNIGPEEFIFHVSYENRINASQVVPNGSEWKARNWDIPFKTNANIYQLDSAQLDPLLMAVRCKNCITFFNICMKDEEFEAKTLNKSIDHVPFVNLSINKMTNCAQNYAVINTNHLIKLWDLHNFQLITNLDQKDAISETDRFAQVVLKGNYLYYVNRTSVNVFDTRTSTSIMNMNHPSLIENNDRFSSICSGGDENQFFVTSFRNIQLIDWRLRSPVYSWSHYFTKPPYISDVINLGEKHNIIAISSHISREKSFCEYNGEMSCIAQSPESLKYTFDNIKCLTDGFTMDHLIKNRLDLSTTGLKFIQKDNRAALLFCNVIGDLFYHDICESGKKQVTFSSKIADFLNWNQRMRNASQTNKYCNTLSRVDRVMFQSILPNHNNPPKEKAESRPKNLKLETCLEFICKSNYGYNTRVTDAWQHVISTLDEVPELSNRPPVVQSVNDWLNKSAMPEIDDN